MRGSRRHSLEDTMKRLRIHSDDGAHSDEEILIPRSSVAVDVDIDSESEDDHRRNGMRSGGSSLRNVDDVFQLNRYQLIFQIFNEFCIFCMMSNMIFMVFAGAQPKIDCAAYEVLRQTSSTNYTALAEQSEFSSAAIEFDLVCAEMWWVTHTVSLQMVGLIAGAFVSGQLSDCFGRRKILLINLTCLMLLGGASAFSPTFAVFLAFRIVIGFFIGGVNTVWAVFIVEKIPRAHRFWLCTAINWAPNYVLFSLVAYLTREWRALAIACCLISIPGVLLLAFVVRESPHFLLQKGRLKEASDVLYSISSWNKETAPSRHELIRLVQSEFAKHSDGEVSRRRYSFWHLYSSREIALHTIATTFGFVAATLVTYSLLFNFSIIEGSLYINTSLSGLLRYVIGIVIAVFDYFVHRAGRKLVHVGSMSVIVCCFMVILPVLHYGFKDEYGYLIRMATLVAFGTTGSLFLQLSLISAELFPTSVRNLANAHANAFSRLGSAVAPSIFGLAVIFKELPYLLLMLICLLDILAITYCVPETKNKPLAEHIDTRRPGKRIDYVVQSSEGDVTTPIAPPNTQRSHSFVLYRFDGIDVKKQ